MNHWRRRKITKSNRETAFLLSQESSNTITTIKVESPFGMGAMREGRDVVVRIMSKPTEKNEQALIATIRKEVPALNGGVRDFAVSDAGLKELIDRASAGGKFPAGKLYDREIERTTCGQVSVATSQTYRKPSKQSRQRKQVKPGRPRNNPS